jgi:hypothetical protein
MQIRTDERTFLDDPLMDTDEERRQRFTVFRDGFRASERAKETSDILQATPELRELMVAIVPVQVTYDVFWLRYYFKESELLREEEKRRQLLRDATLATAQNEEDAFDWDDDEEVQPQEEAAQADAVVEPQPELESVTELVEVPVAEPVQEEEGSDGSLWGEEPHTEPIQESPPPPRASSETSEGFEMVSSSISSVLEQPPPPPTTEKEDDWGEWD